MRTVRNVAVMRIRVAVSILALAGTVAACGPEMPELPEETKFDQPALNPAESKELVHVLNSHRNDWRKLYYTAPGNVSAVIRFPLPAGRYVNILYYTRPAEDQCTMIGWQGDFVGVQEFSSSICGRLDTILIANSMQN